MTTDYLLEDEFKHILAALMPPNRLVLEISLATGLRIGDVLNMRTEPLRASKDRRISVCELKTGKKRRVVIPLELYERALSYAGKIFIFQNRLDWRKHRVRQAVYKDLKRAATLFRVKINLAPHSARKIYAVNKYKSSGDIKKVQALLNHSDEGVTMLYAMADQLTERKKGKGKV